MTHKYARSVCNRIDIDLVEASRLKSNTFRPVNSNLKYRVRNVANLYICIIIIIMPLRCGTKNDLLHVQTRRLQWRDFANYDNGFWMPFANANTQYRIHSHLRVQTLTKPDGLIHWYGLQTTILYLRIFVSHTNFTTWHFISYTQIFDFAICSKWYECSWLKNTSTKTRFNFGNFSKSNTFRKNSNYYTAEWCFSEILFHHSFLTYCLI